MKLIVPWVCLVATVGANVALANEGLDSYREGNYNQAANLLMNNKDKDPIIAYYMGRMRLYGYGDLKNNAEALRSFQQAGDRGLISAQRIMGLYALLDEKNPEQALYWFKKSADANDMSAQMYCAAAYLFGVGTKKNSEVARKYYIAAAKNGNPIAQFALAQYFLDSRQEKSKQLGLIWLNKSAVQNNPAAQVKLGQLYEEGKLVELDKAKAQELLNLAIAQGYIPAVYEMGELVLKENNPQQAKDWFTKAAMAHYAPAEMALSRLYTDEKSPLFDAHTGFLWMLKAAQNGSSDAAQALSLLYKNGIGIEKDENLAAQWQQKANQSTKEDPIKAEIEAANWLSLGKFDKLSQCGYQLKGIFTEWQNPEALKENNYNQPPQMEKVTRETLFQPQFVMINPNDIAISEYYDALAQVLNDPTHQNALTFPRYPMNKNWKSELPPDEVSSQDKTSLAHLQDRAALGDTDAQFTLGQFYQEGVEVNQNIEEAIKLYQLASDQQELKSEYNLGLIYLEGHGVPADYTKGIALLRDAAFKGNDYAQYALARIAELGYRNSAGELIIQPNQEQAIAMYDLAAANDYGPAEYQLAEMLVREKRTDLTVAAKKNRNQTVKQLYQEAFNSGVKEAALPLAFFDAMSKDKTKQNQAVVVAKKEAEAGNTSAAILLGLLYDRGIAGDKNQSQAISWYQKAPNNPVSAFILGTYYSQGIGVSENKQKGEALLTTAANAGLSYANLNLAVFKQQSGGEFLPLLNKSMTLGNTQAALLLADYYLSLANDDQGMQQARDIYQHLADQGDKEGQLKLGFMFEQGLGGKVDMDNASRWYELAANQGQVVAEFLLGHLYQLGQLGKEPDYDLAKKWYSHAQSNYAPAAVALGFINDTVDDNYNQAQNSYQLAADAHDPIGQFNLGLIYENGKGRPVDFAKAEALFQDAATHGHSQSMVQLAGIYFHGLVGTRDDDQALEWYKKAAALGDRDALYQLGLFSETGVAAKLDGQQAIQYYQQAADKGDAKAKLALARIYQYGLIVPKDSVQAEKYYKELAQSGNAYAQYQLALFYYQGVNGKKMPAEGKKMLLAAQENGSLQAEQVLQRLEAMGEERTSYIEPTMAHNLAIQADAPADMMYLDALSEWNRGNELYSRQILDKLLTQFPSYSPAKRAYEQLNQQLPTAEIFG